MNHDVIADSNAFDPASWSSGYGHRLLMGSRHSNSENCNVEDIVSEEFNVSKKEI